MKSEVKFSVGNSYTGEFMAVILFEKRSPCTMYVAEQASDGLRIGSLEHHIG